MTNLLHLLRYVRHLLRRLCHPVVAAGVILLSASACEFRPLEEPSNLTYVRVYVADNLLNVTGGFYDDYIRKETHGRIDVHFIHPDFQRPEILRIGLFDTSDGTLVTERFLRGQGDDEHGHYYDGYVTVDAGTYNLVAYNFGTESAIVTSEDNCYEMFAYTNEIAPSLKGRIKSRTKVGPETKVVEYIRYDADPLFVAGAERIGVPVHNGVDTLRTIDGRPWFDARSLVKSYYLQIGVIGAQYIASAACLLSGMASSTHLLKPDFERSQEATLYFEMHQGTWPDGYKPGQKDYRCIYTTFGTFGHLPEMSTELNVSLEFLTTYGQQVDTTFNISPEFLKEDAVMHQWILPDFIVKIPDPPPGPDPGSGGMAPSVEDWNEVDSEFEI